jgi:acyl carrier protein
MIADSPWLRQLADLPAAERQSMVRDLVVAEMKAWLAMDDSEELPLHESYFQFGLTSLGAVEVKERLEKVIGRRIESVTLFNHPTVTHLVTHLRTEVLQDFFVDEPQAREDHRATEPDAAQRALLDEVLKDLYDT